MSTRPREGLGSSAHAPVYKKGKGQGMIPPNGRVSKASPLNGAPPSTLDPTRSAPLMIAG